jgi:hypothetical protein
MIQLLQEKLYPQHNSLLTETQQFCSTFAGPAVLMLNDA